MKAQLVVRAFVLQVLIAAVAKLFQRRLGWMRQAMAALVQLVLFPHMGRTKLMLPDDKEVRKQWATAVL